MAENVDDFTYVNCDCEGDKEAAMLAAEYSLGIPLAESQAGDRFYMGEKFDHEGTTYYCVSDKGGLDNDVHLIATVADGVVTKVIPPAEVEWLKHATKWLGDWDYYMNRGENR